MLTRSAHVDLRTTIRITDLTFPVERTLVASIVMLLSTYTWHENKIFRTELPWVAVVVFVLLEPRTVASHSLAIHVESVNFFSLGVCCYYTFIIIK